MRVPILNNNIFVPTHHRSTSFAFLGSLCASFAGIIYTLANSIQTISYSTANKTLKRLIHANRTGFKNTKRIITFSCHTELCTPEITFSIKCWNFLYMPGIEWKFQPKGVFRKKGTRLTPKAFLKCEQNLCIIKKQMIENERTFLCVSLIAVDRNVHCTRTRYYLCSISILSGILYV